jgi:PIN domain nuclease of toxin-antitoxin system
MRLLLDTETFLWWAADDKRLSRRARGAIAEETNQCFVSLVTCWEIAIKTSKGKLSLASPVEQLLPREITTHQFTLLPIEISHTGELSRLAHHHRDIFDRMLAAQALVEGLTIVSADPIFLRYGVKRVW